MRIVKVDDPYWRGGKKTKDVRRSHHDVGTDHFRAVDGEGVNVFVVDPGGVCWQEHRYVLLGVGNRQISNPQGLVWREIFEFLYTEFLGAEPRTAFVGFYLGYDFTQWLKTLPEDRARKLLTIEGRESRRSKSEKMKGKFLPVDVDEWQIDMLGAKRFSLRRKECLCETVKCEHPKGPWLYVCDVGSFFQTSFLSVIKPANWQTPIVTEDEYATIVAGKEARATAHLGPEMEFYNRLENEILAHVMHDLQDGFRNLEINLPPQQWIGPGQAAQAWMQGRAPTRKDTLEIVPEWFLEAARMSYFGGWFEIMAHGIVPGRSYENDINNAYPYIISRLPCLLHGKYSHGEGKPPPLPNNAICLVRALVWTAPPHSDTRKRHYVGAALHRDSQGRVARPLISGGWYWLHELDAAKRAHCVSPRGIRYLEWAAYIPCDCPPPLRQVKHLYEMRLQVGKKSSLGKASKLTNNSIYGKTAQSIGLPQFSNAVYASLITAGCRTMILDAIATHPGGKSNVLMVATDGVYFLDPHPLLTYGKGLGEWEQKPKDNLTLFKPGVYWDDEAREQIKSGEHPSFKARGVKAADFAQVIGRIDDEFAAWDDTPPPINDALFSAEEMEGFGVTWPKVKLTAGFAMTTALQALVRGAWQTAGDVQHGKPLVQHANPADKRTGAYRDATDPARPLYRSEPLPAGRNAQYRHPGNIGAWGDILEEKFDSVPYEKRFGMEDPYSDESLDNFGVSPDERQPLMGAIRLLTGKDL